MPALNFSCSFSEIFSRVVVLSENCESSSPYESDSDEVSDDVLLLLADVTVFRISCETESPDSVFDAVLGNVNFFSLDSASVSMSGDGDFKSLKPFSSDRI